MDDQFTPTPWRATADVEIPLRWNIEHVVGNTIIHIADVRASSNPIEDAANAQYIVEACNNYRQLEREHKTLQATNRELLASLDWCMDILQDYHYEDWEDDGEWQQRFDKIAAFSEKLHGRPRPVCEAMVVSAGRTKELVRCRHYPKIGQRFCSFHQDERRRIAPKGE